MSSVEIKEETVDRLITALEQACSQLRNASWEKEDAIVLRAESRCQERLIKSIVESMLDRIDRS